MSYCELAFTVFYSYDPDISHSHAFLIFVPSRPPSFSHYVLLPLLCPTGPIPIGYRFLAQSTSEQTHQIPVDGGPDAVRDYRMLLGKLESFLLDDDSSTIPPVFAKVGI